MSLNWEWAFKCGECGHPKSVTTSRGTTLSQRGHIDSTCSLCDKCGYMLFSGPHPTREVSAAIWWKPWTWGEYQREWREDVEVEEK